MKHRFHVLGIPHTITMREYSTCAFTQKIVKLCHMLQALGHEVIHYGHEDSIVDCDEHVTVTTAWDLEDSYPFHDWRTRGFPDFKLTDRIYQTFRVNAVREIRKRQQPGDFLLCPFGAGHKSVADGLLDLIVVEPGIGYPGGTFAPFRVFESYAVMHVLQGQARLESMSNSMWYDAVIPNYFDIKDFSFSADHDGYLMFLGRIGPGKGTNIAVQIAEALDKKLVVAGMGEVTQDMARTDRPISEYVEQIGVVGPQLRAYLLARAEATICASLYLEPFCGVQIESMLSGTPVISTDWGAFAEYNIHGVTGYRCRTFEQFTWAAKNIDQINRADCRRWAAQFSLERVAKMYDEYFSMVADVHNGNGGWYAPHDNRTNLDWLKRSIPHG
jgi:glycosyltransferase involved in cell wall biosynthesis